MATGWGSATKRAEVRPGDTVVVVGVGGIGINAVQGARMAGAKRIIAIDPVEFKREKAMEMGATHTFPIDTFSQKMLLEGLDELDYIRTQADKIEAHEAAHPGTIDTLQPNASR